MDLQPRLTSASADHSVGTDVRSNENELDRLSYKVYCGNSLDILPTIEEDVHCVVCSPPYFHKRCYGNSQLEVGKEASVDDYIRQLCDLFDSIRLHPLGSVWVNIGDKRDDQCSLMMVPARFALAMKSRGWLLRDDPIWAKAVVFCDGTTEGGFMMEPAPGRLNGNGFEYFYRFTRRKDAWSDTYAVSIPRAGGEPVEHNRRYLPAELMSCTTSTDGRGAPNVWQIGMGQTSKKHYAVFPAALCERPIAMTCPMFVDANGPRSRVVEKVEYDDGCGRRKIGKYSSADAEARKSSGRNDTGNDYIPKRPVTLGWTPLEKDWTPGVVLDPFCGTGTTGEVALKLGRSFIGIDLYENNCAMTRQRCEATLRFMKQHKLNPFQMVN